jgi:dual specificity phosphatase 12
MHHKQIPVVSTPPIIDPSKDRYYCRMCRIALFDENNLQDPPHEASQHQFSYRKVQHGTIDRSSQSDRCQSYFLQTSLAWMGDDILNGVVEGKFTCPKCNAKIGTWIWSGTQCSCGTWVVPAIQIPKSKVDVVKPTIDNPT